MYGVSESDDGCAGGVPEAVRDQCASFILAVEFSYTVDMAERKSGIESQTWTAEDELKLVRRCLGNRAMEFDVMNMVIGWECPSCGMTPGAEFLTDLGWVGVPLEEIHPNAMKLAVVLAVSHGRGPSGEFLSQYDLESMRRPINLEQELDRLLPEESSDVEDEESDGEGT